jgi:hypothetical protein
MKPWLATWALGLVLVTSACDEPLPLPAVAVREPSLDAGDLEVVRAVLDDIRAKVRTARETQRGRGGPSVPAVGSLRFLVMDRTLAMCRRDPGVLGPQPGGCLSPYHANILSEVVSPKMFPAMKLRFPAWNATPMSIAGPLGEDVTLVSPTLVDMTPASELLRSQGSMLVTFSAPGYLEPGVAVITFGGRGGGGAAARLERQPDGRWRVVASASHPQD